MRSDISFLLLVSTLVLALQPLHAEPTAGKTIMARGQVEAGERGVASATTRALARQSPVYLADWVSTGAESASQLRMIDGGLLSMQAQTELAIRTYQFNAASGEGAVSMELLKGGLRTITGAVTGAKSGNTAGAAAGQTPVYQLNTPVATIGVRGTHYQAVLQQGDLYLAGWDGIIDIRVTVAGAEQSFSLGPELPYRFAIVRANGEVVFLLRAPTLFSETLPPQLADQSEFNGQYPATVLASSRDWLTAGGQYGLTLDVNGLDFYDNSRLSAGWGMDQVSRSGTANFNQLSQHSLQSSAGTLSNLSMSLQVDFDGAWVPAGELSFTDPTGEWFAVFSGIFGSEALELYLNFASHGNELADGSISAIFIDNATAVLGRLQLAEVDNPAVSVEGGFVLTEQP